MNCRRPAQSVRSLCAFASTLVLMSSVSCRQPPESQADSVSSKPPEMTDEQVETAARIGAQASQTLMKSLGGQLMAALQSGGPESALQLCQVVAQPLTASTSEKLPTATVTRTALRFRNPENAPDDRDSEILSEWEAILAKGESLPSHRIISIDEKLALFYKPILTQAQCLKCHGDPATFSPALASQIDAAYPGDQAVGFSEGDLRGAFRVQVSLP